MSDDIRDWPPDHPLGQPVPPPPLSPEGFTVNPRTGETPAGGYQVAIPGHAVSDPIYQHPHIWLGGWVDSHGKLWLEPSVNVKSREEALALGLEWGQDSVWDVQAGREIPVPTAVLA